VALASTQEAAAIPLFSSHGVSPGVAQTTMRNFWTGVCMFDNPA
jgi:hypothetical protein